MREPLFTEQLNLKAPEGMLAAVKEAARHQGQSSSEYIHQAIRAQVRRTDRVAAGD
jgi:predicted HicB family RNase H-like nuclease